MSSDLSHAPNLALRVPHKGNLTGVSTWRRFARRARLMRSHRDQESALTSGRNLRNLRG